MAFLTSIPAFLMASARSRFAHQRALFLALVAAVACGLLGPDAPEPTWTSLGLDGEVVGVLAHTPWGLYASTDSSGVFRYQPSTDTWQATGLADQGVIKDLLYVPTVPPRLLAAVAPRRGETVDAVVFASEDGATWVPSDGGYVDTVGSRAAGYSLAYDPRRQEAYLALSGSIIRSKDGGQSWRIVFCDAATEGSIPSITVDDNRSVWFVANWLKTGSVFHSTDGARTWRGRRPEGTEGQRPLFWNDVSVTADGRVWLVATEGGQSGVVVSNDSGETLERELSRETARTLGPAIAHSFLPAGDTLYVVSQQGLQGGDQLRVFRLRRPFRRWNEISVLPGIAGGLSATLDDEGRLVVGTAGTGVWRMEW